MQLLITTIYLLLTTENRELVEHRYYRATPIAELAEKLNRTAGSIKVALLRIRRQLADCVMKRLGTEV